jgi:hypothetical protein
MLLNLILSLAVFKQVRVNPVDGPGVRIGRALTQSTSLVKPNHPRDVPSHTIVYAVSVGHRRHV